MNEKDFKIIINDIKTDIRNTQVKALQAVNSNLIMLYFRLGKMLYDNYKYGNKFISNISRKL